MKRNMNNFLRGGFFVFLLTMSVMVASADPARVVSKRENMPDGGGTKTRIFLDITPNDGNDRADAYVDLPYTNDVMSLQEFSEMIQAGDIFELGSYYPMKDGRFIVLDFKELLALNGKNIYQLFREELGDSNNAYLFSQSRKAYEAQQAAAGKNKQSMLYMDTPRRPRQVPDTQKA